MLLIVSKKTATDVVSIQLDIESKVRVFIDPVVNWYDCCWSLFLFFNVYNFATRSLRITYALSNSKVSKEQFRIKIERNNKLLFVHVNSLLDLVEGHKWEIQFSKQSVAGSSNFNRQMRHSSQSGLCRIKCKY